MADDPEFRVYISSTVDDLVEERAAAKDVIQEYAVVKHSYRPGRRHARDVRRRAPVRGFQLLSR
jgi:hypothetical protein